MTMHLVGPYMTTTRYNRKQKPSNNKRNIAAQAEHDKWLRKMNAHPDQIKETKRKMLVFLFVLSLIIAVWVILSLLVMLFLEDQQPPPKDKYTLAKENYWASR